MHTGWKSRGRLWIVFQKICVEVYDVKNISGGTTLLPFISFLLISFWKLFLRSCLNLANPLTLTLVCIYGSHQFLENRSEEDETVFKQKADSDLHVSATFSFPLISIWIYSAIMNSEIMEITFFTCRRKIVF